MAYFPMFIDLNDQQCLVVGGGAVALRKVKVLREFGAVVTVVAQKICEEIKIIGDIHIKERAYRESDTNSMTLVVAATDDKALNHTIGQYCMKHKIPVNAVDQVEDCSFIFGSYVREQDLVAAFSSAGKSPVMTQYLKAQMKSHLTEELGALNECLGSIREQVKAAVDTEAMRKKVYQEVMKLGLQNEHLPTKHEIDKIVEKYCD